MKEGRCGFFFWVFACMHTYVIKSLLSLGGGSPRTIKSRRLIRKFKSWDRRKGKNLLEKWRPRAASTKFSQARKRAAISCHSV